MDLRWYIEYMITRLLNMLTWHFMNLKKTNGVPVLWQSFRYAKELCFLFRQLHSQQTKMLEENESMNQFGKQVVCFLRRSIGDWL